MYTTDVLKKRMIDGAYDAELTRLYPAGTIDAQRKRYCRVIGEFEEFYGEGREIIPIITTAECSPRASTSTL